MMVVICRPALESAIYGTRRQSQSQIFTLDWADRENLDRPPSLIDASAARPQTSGGPASGSNFRGRLCCGQISEQLMSLAHPRQPLEDAD